MSFSYPSTAVTLVDLGEVTSLKTEFIYNFFTPDEGVNDEGDVAEQYRPSSSELPKADYIDTINSRIPRLVRINFSPVVPDIKVRNNEFKTTNFSEKNYGANDFSIQKFYDRIIYEESFTDSEFTHVNFRDSAIDDRLFMAVSGTVTQESRIKNSKINRRINSTIKQMQANVSSRLESQLDAARFLQSETPPSIDPDFITNSLVRLDKLGALIVDESTQKQIRSKVFDRVKDVNINARINARVLGDSVRSIVNAPSGLLSDDFAPYLKKAVAIQDQAANNSSATTVSQSRSTTPDGDVEVFSIT